MLDLIKTFIAIIRAIFNPNTVLPPTAFYQLRGSDSRGSGHFGASRDGGARIHRGLDIVSVPGEPVFAPTDGRVSVGSMGVTITNQFLQTKTLYIDALNGINGKMVNAGDRIGTAQDITVKYQGIKNHVHFEVIINGVHIDPEIIINRSYI